MSAVRRSHHWCVLGFACVLGVASCRKEPAGESGAESEFPRKPVKVIVPFPAGGGSDTFSRIIQKAVRDESASAAADGRDQCPRRRVGRSGSRRVRDAPADGYTILNLHEGILSSKYSGRVPYGPEAFRPIAATGQSALVVCVREDSPLSDR